MFRGTKTIVAFSCALALGQCQTLFAGSHESADTPKSESTTEPESPEASPEAEQAAELYNALFVDGNQTKKTDGRYAIEETDSFKASALYLLGDQSQKDFTEKDIMMSKFYLSEALLKLEQNGESEDAQAIARLKAAVTQGMKLLKLAEPSSKKSETDTKVPAKMGDLAKELAEKDVKDGDLMKKLFAAQIEITQKAEERLKAGKGSELDRAIIDARKALGDSIRSLLGDSALKAPEGRNLVAAIIALKSRFNDAELMKSLSDAEYDQLKNAILKGEALSSAQPYQWASGENVLKLMNGANALYNLGAETLFGKNETGKDKATQDAHNKAISDAYGAISDIIKDPFGEAAKALKGADGAAPPAKEKITEADRLDGLALADSFLDVSPQAHFTLPRPIVRNEQTPEQEAPDAGEPKSDRESAPSTQGDSDEQAPTEQNAGSNPQTDDDARLAQMPQSKPPSRSDASLASMLSQIGTVRPSRHKGNSGGPALAANTGLSNPSSETLQTPKANSPLFAESNAPSGVTEQATSTPALALQAQSKSTLEKSSQANANMSASPSAGAGAGAGANSPRPANTTQEKGFVYSGGQFWGMAIPASSSVFDTNTGVASSESNWTNAPTPNLPTGGRDEMYSSNRNRVRSIRRTPNPKAVTVDELYGAANGAAAPSMVQDTAGGSPYSESSIEEQGAPQNARPTTKSLYGANPAVMPTQSQVAQASSILDPYIEKAKQWMGMDSAEPAEEQESQRSLASIDAGSPALRAAAKAVSEILKDNFGIAYNAPAKFTAKEKASASSTTTAQQAIQKLLASAPKGGDLTSFLKKAAPTN
jgi:hypothetical protein